MSKRKTDIPKPYTIKNVGGQRAEILIYEQIGSDFWEEGITAKTFARDLQAKGKIKHIDVRINSPGGSVFDGLAIYNALKQHPAEVTVYIDGMALSIASVVAMAGDQIKMAQNALMMVHNPKGVVAGDAAEMRRFADVLDKMRDSIVSAYQTKTAMENESLIAMLDAETWMSAEEAVDNGFADEITDQLAVAAHCQIPAFLNVPATVQAKLQPLETETAMADSTSDVAGTPERIPATVQQLKTMPGVEAEFIVDQLTVQATVEEAQQALNARLVDRLAAAQAEIAELKAKAVVAPPVAPAAPPHPQVQPVDIGTQPLVSNSAGSDPTATSEWGDDPAKFHRQLMRKFTNEGLSASAAMQRIAEDYPDLMDAMIG